MGARKRAIEAWNRIVDKQTAVEDYFKNNPNADSYNTIWNGYEVSLKRKDRNSTFANSDAQTTSNSTFNGFSTSIKRARRNLFGSSDNNSTFGN